MAASRRYRINPLSIREITTFGVVANATVTVYLAGTTTAATCYANTTIATALASSQTTTNSSGYFEFYIDSADYRPLQKFKIVVTKTGYSDVSYDHLDIIIPFADDLDLREFLPYGYVINGSVDYVTQFQSAVTTTGGGVLKLPRGTFTITTSLTGGTHGIIFKGMGRENTIIRNAGSGAAFTTPAAIRGYTIEDLQILGIAGSTDCIEMTANFGHIQLRNLLLKPIRHAVNASAGNGIDILMDSVRGEGGTTTFNFSSGGTVINSIKATNCYANNSSNIGFDIYNVATFTAVECSSDNHTNYGWQIGTNATLIGCTAEANDVRGFTVTGAGDIAFIDCRTTSQLLPFHINAAGANVTFINPRTASTPSGPSIDGATFGDVVLIGGSNLDGGLSSASQAALGWRFTSNQFILNNHKIVYGTAAPSTGTWAVGDMAINSTPVVGQPKGWRCTVAGTPGTWVSEGNL